MSLFWILYCLRKLLMKHSQMHLVRSPLIALITVRFVAACMTTKMIVSGWGIVKNMARIKPTNCIQRNAVALQRKWSPMTTRIIVSSTKNSLKVCAIQILIFMTEIAPILCLHSASRSRTSQKDTSCAAALMILLMTKVRSSSLWVQETKKYLTELNMLMAK